MVGRSVGRSTLVNPGQPSTTLGFTLTVLSNRLAGVSCLRLCFFSVGTLFNQTVFVDPFTMSLLIIVVIILYCTRVCQYAKGFLIRSSLRNIWTSISSFLPFFFFQISFIFYFFINPYLAPNLYREYHAKQDQRQRCISASRNGRLIL